MTAQDDKKGVILSIAAFCWWGLVPIYFKSLSHVSPLDILCHRIVWSVLFTGVLIQCSHGWGELSRALSSKKTCITLLATAILVGGNWLIFIYAISTGRILESSLGYYLNPLMNVLLGMVFLKERLTRLQIVAVALAAVGTANLAYNLGSLPWISLSLAFTFSVYGLLRKTVKIESLNGLFVETAMLAPLALGYLIFLASRGAGAFVAGGFKISFLLSLAGVVTSLPLLWFTAGARRLRYTTVGFIQYLAPSLQFSLAVFFYGEAFTAVHLVTFGFIWTGLAVFMADSLRAARRYNSGHA